MIQTRSREVAVVLTKDGGIEVEIAPKASKQTPNLIDDNNNLDKSRRFRRSE
jgi:hypothetical protein